MLQQMQSGALDMGYIMTAELGSRVPAIAAINAPWIVDSTAKVAKLVKTPVAMSLFDLLPRETGTVGLAWGITTMRVVFTAKPIEGISDLKGMKLRINTTPAYKDFYQLLGAAPTPIPTPQVFEAMSNGQVDGLEADLDFSWNQRFDKVSKTMLRMNAIFHALRRAGVGPGLAGPLGRGQGADHQGHQDRPRCPDRRDRGERAVLLEKFKGTGISIKEAKIGDAETKNIIAEYDKIWVPKAPILTELRKVGATL